MSLLIDGATLELASVGLTTMQLIAATEEVSGIVSFLSSTWLWTKVALGIGLVIFVHELGHFLAAKLFGVKCEKFYVGFDVPIQIGPIKFPRTLGKFTYGETEYGIGILPLGGYVKMLGQDDDPRRAEEEAERIRLADGDAGDAPQLDPRSYPAKPVWQRMIIISAGVVMNIITGVMFAAVAYFYGVPYTPSIVGSVAPGGPAWEAGIEPGGRVVGIADMQDDELHFNKMSEAIMMEAVNQPTAPIDVRVTYGQSDREYQLVTAPHPLDSDLRMIGVHGPSSNQLSGAMVSMLESSASEVLTDDDVGAKIVSVDGTPIDETAVMPITPLLNRIHSSPSEPIDITLVRRDGEQRTVTLPRQKAKDFGVRFGMGPITGLVKNGPAEKAGLKVGDQIIAIDGQDNVDAYTLLLDYTVANGPVEVTVRRGEGDKAETETVWIEPAQALQTRSPVSEMGDLVASPTLGLAYTPVPIVASVTDAKSTLQPGDRIHEVQFRFADTATKDKLADRLSPDSLKALTSGWEIGPTMPLVALMEAVQIMPGETEVLIKATRPPEGTVIEDTVTLVVTGRDWYDRGLNLVQMEAIQTADSLGAAISLGVREGIQKMRMVGRFLGMLVTGKVKAKFVGGPIRIAQMASMEAERGISAQLLFLTMLSMNLAILNFLPIPALDGGHMVFLTAEAIRGKKVDEALEMRLTMAGVLALLALMVFVFANDILHLK